VSDDASKSSLESSVIAQSGMIDTLAGLWSCGSFCSQATCALASFTMTLRTRSSSGVQKIVSAALTRAAAMRDSSAGLRARVFAIFGGEEPACLTDPVLPHSIRHAKYSSSSEKEWLQARHDVVKSQVGQRQQTRSQRRERTATFSFSSNAWTALIVIFDFE
jgi:hypothetical protein